MRPLQISAETAVTLSKKLGVPIEHLMHMPQHILMQKLAELAKEESSPAAEKSNTSTDQAKDKHL
ncbi:YycC family protein [Paenibacillus sp. Marseille-Q7038]